MYARRLALGVGLLVGLTSVADRGDEPGLDQVFEGVGATPGRVTSRAARDSFNCEYGVTISYTESG